MFRASLFTSAFVGSLALAGAIHTLAPSANAQIGGGHIGWICWPYDYGIIDFGANACPNDGTCSVGMTITQEVAAADCAGCKIRGWGWVTCTINSIPPTFFTLSSPTCENTVYLDIPCPTPPDLKGRVWLTCEVCHSP